MITPVISLYNNKLNMKYKLITAGLLLSGAVFAGSLPQKYSKQDYIELWKDVAMQNQREFKIPASITLAQGVLESGFGNSELAQKANNHFGIKCHNWSGEKVYMDDDRKDDCFRKYDDASQSYSDHSVFLTSRSRYASLFDLEITDYRGWAKGLKKAGYATNPKYPALLIKIIEENGLTKYDHESNGMLSVSNKPVVASAQTVQAITSKTHQTALHKNKVRFVVAKKGDTFYKIAKEKGMNLWQLYKYNDFSDKKECLEEGEFVYLQPKRNKSKNKEKIFLISKPLSLRDVSQIEGIKLKKLQRYNPSVLDVDKKLAQGAEVFLK